MLEMQAVVGRVQLQRMSQWNAQRTANAARLAAKCQKLPLVRVPVVPEDIVHAYYKFYAFVQPERLASGWNRDRIVDEMMVRGVPCYQGSCSEVYLEKAFDNSGLRPAERLPAARELGETSLMMLVHPTLTVAEIDRSCVVLEEVLTQACSPH